LAPSGHYINLAEAFQDSETSDDGPGSMPHGYLTVNDADYVPMNSIVPRKLQRQTSIALTDHVYPKPQETTSEPEWFHGILSREASEKLLQSAGPGHFLIRQRDEKADSFAMSLLKVGGFVHHLLQKQPSGAYTIDGKSTPIPLCSFEEVIEAINLRETGQGRAALVPLAPTSPVDEDA
jgi:hypothetical protein